MLSKLAFLGSVGLAASQQAGTVAEGGPSVPLRECTTSGGCTTSQYTAVLDSNWRWSHSVDGYTNCFADGKWDATLCPDPQTCAKNCALEGVTADQYESSYGVSSKDGGVSLKFVTTTQYGSSVGSRLYLLDGPDSYKLFKLKNRELSFDVSVSELPCGLNGALYFSEMDQYGGKGDGNLAGAKYGTGYCDAQCPHDVKWIGGEANLLDWDTTAKSPVGHYGSCCAELDIWEANRMAAALTPHPCTMSGQKRCEGIECGDNQSGQRYDGVCDKDGCDYNSFRLGEKGFLGTGAGFTVDTTQPITVVTQFITSDGTDAGDLVEIRRFYKQNGNVIPNSHATILGPQAGDSITDDFCTTSKTLFGNQNDFAVKGGLKAMGEAMDRGMVLVMSLWDDSDANMLWLDSNYPEGESDSQPGIARGPCAAGEANTPDYLRRNVPDSSVSFTNLAVGEIGSTALAEAVLSV